MDKETLFRMFAARLIEIGAETSANTALRLSAAALMAKLAEATVNQEHYAEAQDQFVVALTNLTNFVIEHGSARTDSWMQQFFDLCYRYLSN